VDEMSSSKKKVTGGLEAPDFSEYIDSTPLWSEIIPGLWVGGTDDNDVLGDIVAFGSKKAFVTKEHFDSVVTMYQFANPVDWLVKEYRYCIYDADIEHVDLSALFDAVKFAHEEWKRGKKTLVRCQAGLNRSGLVTALVLIREGHSPHEAIELIRSKRHSMALFNRRFVDFLNQIDLDLWRGADWKSPSACSS